MNIVGCGSLLVMCLAMTSIASMVFWEMSKASNSQDFYQNTDKLWLNDPCGELDSNKFPDVITDVSCSGGLIEF